MSTVSVIIQELSEYLQVITLALEF